MEKGQSIPRLSEEELLQEIRRLEERVLRETPYDNWSTGEGVRPQTELPKRRPYGHKS